MISVAASPGEWMAREIEFYDVGCPRSLPRSQPGCCLGVAVRALNYGDE